MYPYTNSPKPLSDQAFYVLLVLAESECHPYAISNAVHNASLGAVAMNPGRIYRLIEHLHDEGLVDLADKYPTGKSPVPRKHYRASEEGIIRLKEELARLAHALKIAKNAGLTEAGVPLDIQRLLLETDHTG